MSLLCIRFQITRYFQASHRDGRLELYVFSEKSLCLTSILRLLCFVVHGEVGGEHFFSYTLFAHVYSTDLRRANAFVKGARYINYRTLSLVITRMTV